jgi:hypothetical protein
VKRAGAQISLLPDEAKAQNQIEAAFCRLPAASIRQRSTRSRFPSKPGRSEKLLQLLAPRQSADPHHAGADFFTTTRWPQLRTKLASYKKAKASEISVSVLKELTGISRKYAHPACWSIWTARRVTRRQVTSVLYSDFTPFSPVEPVPGTC